MSNSPEPDRGAAAAALVSGLLFVPIGAAVFVHHPPTAGALSSAVPFLVDLLALRRVPARYFGLFMSVHPVLASLVGLVVLGQVLSAVEWLAVAAIVGANAVSVLWAAPRRTRAATTTAPGQEAVRRSTD